MGFCYGNVGCSQQLKHRQIYFMLVSELCTWLQSYCILKLQNSCDVINQHSTLSVPSPSFPDTIHQQFHKRRRKQTLIEVRLIYCHILVFQEIPGEFAAYCVYIPVGIPTSVFINLKRHICDALGLSAVLSDFLHGMKFWTMLKHHQHQKCTNS